MGLSSRDTLYSVTGQTVQCKTIAEPMEQNSLFSRRKYFWKKKKNDQGVGGRYPSVDFTAVTSTEFLNRLTKRIVFRSSFVN